MPKKGVTKDLDAALGWYQRIAAQRRPQCQRTNSDPKGWTAIAAATGASLAMVGTADAEVQFFSPPSPLRISVMGTAPGTDSLTLDLDQNGQQDVKFQVSRFESIDGTVQRTLRQAFGEAAILNNAIIGSSDYAFRLLSGANISAGLPLEFQALLFEERKSVTSGGTFIDTRGEWDAESVGIVGARFQIAGDDSLTNHFAWIRVKTEMTEPETALEIINWAYEDAPGASIRAGDETGRIVIPGDYDGNRQVNLADYEEWKETFGASRIAGAAADGNGNEIVDAADYVVWRKAIGNSASPQASVTSTSVPEPHTSLLAALALGAAGVMALRNGRTSDQ